MNTTEPVVKHAPASRTRPTVDKRPNSGKRRWTEDSEEASDNDVRNNCVFNIENV